VQKSARQFINITYTKSTSLKWPYVCEPYRSWSRAAARDPGPNHVQSQSKLEALGALSAIFIAPALAPATATSTATQEKLIVWLHKFIVISLNISFYWVINLMATWALGNTAAWILIQCILVRHNIFACAKLQLELSAVIVVAICWPGRPPTCSDSAPNNNVVRTACIRCWHRSRRLRRCGLSYLQHCIPAPQSFKKKLRAGLAKTQQAESGPKLSCRSQSRALNLFHATWA